MLQVSATQFLIYTLLLVNSEKTKKIEFEEIINKYSISKDTVVELESKAFKDSGEDYLEKEIEIKYQNIDLSVRNFLKIIK